MASYFPAKLVRTKELDPSKNYIFVMQPHGWVLLQAFWSARHVVFMLTSHAS